MAGQLSPVRDSPAQPKLGEAERRQLGCPPSLAWIVRKLWRDSCRLSETRLPSRSSAKPSEGWLGGRESRKLLRVRSPGFTFRCEVLQPVGVRAEAVLRRLACVCELWRAFPARCHSK